MKNANFFTYVCIRGTYPSLSETAFVEMEIILKARKIQTTKKKPVLG